MEILLATFVLAVVMIPILQLIFGGLKDTARGRDRATAVSLATNIMSQLLHKVPFDQFQPDEGPTPLDVQAFFQSQVEQPGLYATRKQCLLGGTDSVWEKLLDQTPGDGQRTIVKEGTSFEVILFAGMYKDDGAPREGRYDVPHLTEELTFSFFRNPRPQPDDASDQAAIRKQVVLQSHFPYAEDGEFTRDRSGSTPDYMRRADYPELRPGWPNLAGPITEDNFYRGDGQGKTPAGSGDDPNADVRLEWPRRTFDLSEFRESEGVMLKLVLGLRWKPGADGTRGSDYTKTTKEFWLVSFKAKLEDD